MAGNLWEIDNLVTDAINCLNHALDIASESLTNSHTGEPIPWKEMEATADRIGAALTVLGTAIEPIKDALKDESDHLDHLSDLADGQSL
jgi:hypothetical protein